MSTQIVATKVGQKKNLLCSFKSIMDHMKESFTQVYLFSTHHSTRSMNKKREGSFLSSISWLWPFCRITLQIVEEILIIFTP